MFHRHPLRESQRNACVETAGGYLHQQRLLTVFIGQFEVMAQCGIDDEEPLQPIGALDGATRHQHIALPRDVNRLWQVVLRRIGIERTGIGVEPHLWVGTHIDRTVQSRFQILDIEAELIHIGPSCRLIEVLVELQNLGFVFWQFLFCCFHGLIARL